MISRSDQWIGKAQDPLSGIVVVESDNNYGIISGTIHYFPTDKVAEPAAQITFSDSRELNGTTQLQIIWMSSSGSYLTEEYVRSESLPRLATVNAIEEENSLSIIVNTIGENYYFANLSASPNIEVSNPSPPENQYTWKGFVERFLDGEDDHSIFRGQQGPWPLKSSFHRSPNRKVLARYVDEDALEVRNHLTPIWAYSLIFNTHYIQVHFGGSCSIMGTRHHYWIGLILHL